MASGKFTIDTLDASKKIDALQSKIDTLETDIKKDKEFGISTKVAEAQVKGLRNAISSIVNDIAKVTKQDALGTSDLFHTDENIRKLKNLSSQITSLYKNIAGGTATKTEIEMYNKLNASFNRYNSSN